jgi:hypothetical protein
MIGRLFNLILLTALASVVLRACLRPAQRQALHQLFQVIATALLLSALLLAGLVLGGFISR